MIKKIFFSLFLGLLASIFFLQQDPAINKLLEDQCEQLLCNALKCTIQFHLSSFNLLTGNLTLNKIVTTPDNKANWRWECKQAIIHFSLWELASHKKLGMHILFEDLQAKTSVTDGSIDIIPHIQQTMIGFSPDAPVLLRTVTFQRSHLELTDPLYGHQATISWSSRLLFSEDRLNASFHSSDGILTIAHQQYGKMILGTIVLELPYDMAKPWSIAVDLKGNVPQLPIQGINCFCTGSINNNQGSFTLRTIDDRIRIDPLTIDLSNNQKVLKATAQLPIEEISRFIKTPKAEALAGTCMLTARYSNNATQTTLDGIITGANISYHKMPIAEKCKLSFALNNDRWSGKINARYNNTFAIHGLWEWETNKRQGNLMLTNSKQLNNPQWPSLFIEQDGAKLSLTLNDQLMVDGSYEAKIEHHKTGQATTVCGKLHLDQQELSLQGTANDLCYQGTMCINPLLGIKQFVCKKNNQEELITIQGKKPDYQRFTSSISLTCINAITELLGNVTLQGEGKLDLLGVLKQDKLLLKTSFKNGTIRLPQTYNCINNLEAIATFDWLKKCAILNQFHCTLYEGACRSQRAIITFDDHWQLSTLHLPILLDHCLLNIKKDFFAVVSGNLLFDKQDQQTPLLKGHLILNRSQLADNIFSGAFHETLAQYTKDTVSVHGTAMNSDITIETQHPIRIKNSFFDTQARAGVHLTGRIYAPSLAGYITLNGGNLLFPYKPLIITKGNLILNSQQLDDPIIELTAKNKIKKYVVTLSVIGSLKHHQINVSSTPPLSEEQIISLLLLGFEEASLSSVAPALVMNNFTNLLFGSDPASFFQRLLANLPESFKKVHFIPSFNDQSGRGGLRGNLEIDINDRWHASIQKNFNLLEDTRFALEYLLSDDISLKGTRDEHRDISGEVEMRFKF